MIAIAGRLQKLLQEADGGTGATETQYLSTESEYGDLVSGYGSGATKYHGFDALGSTEVLLDDTGSVTAQFEYRAFGITNETSGVGGESPGLALPAPLPSELGGGTSATTGEPFAFVGRQNYYRDTETGLYLLGAGGNDSEVNRYYDPAGARFLTKDPIEEAGGSVNFYLYCGNDPVNMMDPSGNVVLVPRLGFDSTSARGQEDFVRIAVKAGAAADTDRLDGANSRTDIGLFQPKQHLLQSRDFSLKLGEFPFRFVDRHFHSLPGSFGLPRSYIRRYAIASARSISRLASNAATV